MNIPIWIFQLFLTFMTSLLIIHLYTSVFHPRCVCIEKCIHVGKLKSGKNIFINYFQSVKIFWASAHRLCLRDNKRAFYQKKLAKTYACESQYFDPRKNVSTLFHLQFFFAISEFSKWSISDRLSPSQFTSTRPRLVTSERPHPALLTFSLSHTQICSFEVGCLWIW